MDNKNAIESLEMALCQVNDSKRTLECAIKSIKEGKNDPYGLGLATFVSTLSSNTSKHITQAIIDLIKE